MDLVFSIMIVEVILSSIAHRVCRRCRNKKKKKGPQVVNGDKSGRGLRQFSMKGTEVVV